MKNIKSKIFSCFFAFFLLFTNVCNSLDSVFHHENHDEHTHHHEDCHTDCEHKEESINSNEHNEIKKQGTFEENQGRLYTIETVETNENSTIYFDVYAENIECIGLEIEIYYDTKYFSCIDNPVNYVGFNDETKDLFTYDISKQGIIKITYLFLENVRFGGAILSFSLKTSEVNKIINTYIDVCVGNAFDREYNTISIDSKGSYVTIFDITTSNYNAYFSGSVNKDAIYKDDVFEYSLSLTESNTGIICGEITVEYNKEQLLYEDIIFTSEIDDLIIDVNTEVSGVIFISFVTLNEITYCDKFLNIKFKAVNEEKYETVITSNFSNFFNKNYEIISISSSKSYVQLLDNDSFSETPTIYLNDVNTDAAKEFQIYVSLGKNTNLAAGDFYINFDYVNFYFVSYEINSSNNIYIGVNSNKSQEGLLHISVLSTTNIVDNINLCVLTFKSFDMYFSSISSINISGKNTYDQNFNPIELQYINSNVTTFYHSNHEYNEWVVETEATCEQSGQKYRTCIYCGQIQYESIPSKGGHNYQSTIIEPTCTTSGYTLYNCVECGNSYTDNWTDLLPHDYSYNEMIIEATCENYGYIYRYCKCGESITEYIDPLGHEFKIEVIDSTCVDSGKTIYSCIRCDYSYEEIISATGHDEGAWVTVKDSTCTESGSENRVCNTCGEVLETRIITAKGHSFIDTIINPTCTEQGYTLHICGDCGYSYKDNYVDATGHSYGEWVIDKNPTCVESGSKHKTCHCGHTITETIATTGHDEGTWITVKGPTCTENGSENRVCNTCGEVLETRKVSAKGHSFIDTIINPTCTEQGYTLHTCSECDYTYKDNYTNSTGHTYSDWIVDEDATFENEGSKHKYCLICGDVVTESIPMLRHEFIETIVNPTCAEDGYTLYTCSKCGYSYKDNYVDATGHSYGEWVIDKNPTCVESGSKHKTCHCGHTITETIAATGHDEGTWVIVKDSTCTESGSENRVCNTCGEVLETRIITAKGHSFIDTIIDPTCTEQGYTLHTCNECDYSYKDNYVDATGHSYGEWVIDKNPTCVEPGSKHKTCHCGHTITETIAATGHDEGTWVIVKDSTCTESGSENRVCNTCGEVLETRKINANGHSFTDSIIDPTCTEQGYTLHTCSECGYSYKDNFVAKYGHDFSNWETTTNPTCTSLGEEERVCKTCGYKETRIISATGHDEGTWITVKDPTCTESGSENRVCNTCGEVLETRKINANGHSFTDTIINPTCTEQGYTLHTCNECDYSYKDNYVDATGHSYGEWVIDKNPTCVESGSKHKTCHCGHTITETIAATGHDEGTWITVKDPTCTENGSENLVCNTCGEVLETRKISAKGHSFTDTIINPTCTEQGYTLHSCSECGYTYKDSYVDPTGHSFGDYEVEIEATCTEDGILKRTCSCGYSETKSYKKGEHTHTVTFIVDGDTYITIDVKCGEEISLPNPPVKGDSDGYTYTFSYWENYIEGTKVYSDLTLIAIFTSQKINKNLPIILGASIGGTAVTTGISIGFSFFFKRKKKFIKH